MHISFESWRLLLSLLAVILLVGCERSAEVGWADREGRDDTGPRDTAAPAASGGEPLDEYERLGSSLNPILGRAMEEEDLRERYLSLIAEVENAVAEESSFYRGLMAREEEIEARFAEAQESGEPLPEEERSKLLYQYRNINYELKRIVDYELQAGEFKDAFWEFKLDLFARMRELAPDRAEDIDRLQELERDRPVEILPPLQENIQITPAEPPER